jgi:hypothetical protein
LGEKISAFTGSPAISAVAIPLRNPAAGRRAKNSYLHGLNKNRRGLGRNLFQLISLFAGVHVGRDFHAQADFFEFRFDPVHIFIR